MTELFSTAEGNQRNLRIVLLVIILATFPFYCLGFILWSAAPQDAQSAQRTPTPTLTPLSINTQEATITRLATQTPLQVVTMTPIGIILTPTSFGGVIPPPVVIPPTQFFPPTQFIPPTVFIPPPTLAPTFTPIPPDTAVPGPTTTTIPFFPTDTPDS